MVWSAYMGLPLSLAGAGAVLGLSEQKLKEGKDLIKYFCVPCAATKANGGRTRNLPEHAPEKWAQFKAYNKRDVEVEMSIQDKLRKFPVPDFVWAEYSFDQQINDRGIALDMAVVENAIKFDERSKALLLSKMQEITALENPNSVQQMKQWLSENGLEVDSLGKKEVAQAVKTAPKELAEELEKLKPYAADKASLDEFMAIKRRNKERLAEYIRKANGVVIDPDSLFDIQVKRLHEYKRQQMNALYAIYKYMDIKSGNKPKTPITMVFGAKAAPAYIIAKDIIHLILCLQELIDNDPEVSPYFKVIMLENYNVSKAAKVIPAADISEQISLASKEASGTGNMKFMLNGALTLGTEDGANVEIGDLVGKENIYIFGKKPQDVIDLYADAAYCSKDIYDEDPEIAKLVDFIVSDELLAIGDKVCLERLYKEILNKDWFMTLLDLKEYIKTKERVYKDYENKDAWNKKCLINIAKAGFFSSDRTIAQYNEDIWHLA